MTPSIRIALEDLGLERIAVVYPGKQPYPLSENVEVVPIAALADRGSLFGDPLPQAHVYAHIRSSSAAM